MELMENVLKDLDITVLIEGEARGADLLARRYAERRKIPVNAFPALWDKHGKAAGPIRNTQMLSEGRPDLVVAFLYHVGAQEVMYGLSDSQYNRGAKHMINIAQKAGVETVVIDVL